MKRKENEKKRKINRPTVRSISFAVPRSAYIRKEQQDKSLSNLKVNAFHHLDIIII